MIKLNRSCGKDLGLFRRFLVDRLKNTCDSGFSNRKLSRRRHPHPVKYGYLRSLLAAKINNGSAANA